MVRYGFSFDDAQAKTSDAPFHDVDPDLAGAAFS